LKRDDGALVEWAYSLLVAAEGLPDSHAGLFSARSQDDLDSFAVTSVALEEIETADPSEAVRSSGEPGFVMTPLKNDGSEHEDEDEDDDEGEEFDPFDSIIDADGEPFPSAQIDDTAPLDVRIAALVSLVSNILRDSDSVESPELKEAALGRTLTVWGHYVEILERSPEYMATVKGIVASIFAGTDLSTAERTRLESELVRTWPIFQTVAIIDSELSTIKLSKALGRVLAQGGATSPGSPHLAVAVAIMAMHVRFENWLDILCDLWRDYGDLYIVHRLCGAMAWAVYLGAVDVPISQRQMSQAEELLVDLNGIDASPAKRQALRRHFRMRRSKMRFQQSIASKNSDDSPQLGAAASTVSPSNDS
jgi:hypothetical protein